MLTALCPARCFDPGICCLVPPWEAIVVSTYFPRLPMERVKPKEARRTTNSRAEVLN